MLRIGFLFFPFSFKSKLLTIPVKTKSPAILAGLLHLLWTRRDSNSRPNKELISFLQSLEQTWFSIQVRRLFIPNLNLDANIALDNIITKTSC